MIDNDNRLVALNEEPLYARLWRQVEHGIDEDRLLPTRHKRGRAVEKKLARPLDVNGWRIFVSGQAHAIANAKAKQRKNAEAMLVRTVRRWVDDVVDLCPERIHDLRRIVAHGLDNPAPVPQRPPAASP
ncbi:MAG: hypothetical protein OXN18_15545 [Gemmatimonadota bacterium]|nr:hypothetical protein [Gemmatimonadota bacterium]